MHLLAPSAFHTRTCRLLNGHDTGPTDLYVTICSATVVPHFSFEISFFFLRDRDRMPGNQRYLPVFNEPIVTALVHQQFSLPGKLRQFFIARHDNVSASTTPNPFLSIHEKVSHHPLYVPVLWQQRERTLSAVIMFSLFTGLYGALPEIRRDGITRHHRPRRTVIYWHDCEKIQQRSSDYRNGPVIIFHFSEPLFFGFFWIEINVSSSGKKKLNK